MAAQESDTVIVPLISGNAGGGKDGEEYIRNQLQGDITSDQMSMKEYIDPFTGEPEKNK